LEQKVLTELHVLVLGEETIEKIGLCTLLSQLRVMVHIESKVIYDRTTLERYPHAIILLERDPTTLKEAVSSLRLAQPNAIIIVASWRTDFPTIRRAINDGASGFLPLQADRFAASEALEIMLRGSIYVPPASTRDSPETHKRPSTPASAAPKLTRRQTAVLQELSNGLPNKEIAANLGLTEATVKIHIGHLIKAMGAKNRMQAVLIAEKFGLIQRSDG
jgi:DNA-binding NarL/FixJ family response regulator